MALEKEKEINGFTANYWVITQHEIDRTSRTIKYILHLFKDKAYRDANFNPKDAMTREVRRASWPEGMTEDDLKSLTVNELYAMLYEDTVKSETRTEIDFETSEEILVEQNWFADAKPIIE